MQRRELEGAERKVVLVAVGRCRDTQRRWGQKILLTFFRFIKNHNRSLFLFFLLFAFFCMLDNAIQLSDNQVKSSNRTQPRLLFISRSFPFSPSLCWCDDEKENFFCLRRKFSPFPSPPFLIEFIPSEIILMFLQIYCYSSATFLFSLPLFVSERSYSQLWNFSPKMKLFFLKNLGRLCRKVFHQSKLVSTKPNASSQS